MIKVADELSRFLSLYKSKSDKISSEQEVFQLGVYGLPKFFKAIAEANVPCSSWAYEGSVGKGSWSRTPWVAIYDTRVTERASDGFYIAMISSESLEKIFLVLTNTSSTHINYQPYTLNLQQVGGVDGFTLGAIPKGLLSQSGRGSGPDFEQSTLLWREIDTKGLKDFEQLLVTLLKHYKKLVDMHASSLPKDKPFRPNPFMVR